MDSIRQHLKPQGIIAYYKGDGGHSYAEIHPIVNGQRLSARPIAIEDLKSLTESITKEKKKHSYRCDGLLSENILLAETTQDSYTLCWTTPAKERTVTFAKAKPLTFIAPPTLYLASGNSLQVFHFTDEKRPTEKTQLYECIMPNTMDKGRICFGSIKRDIPKQCSYQELIEIWDNYYWNTKFTNAHMDDIRSKEFKRLYKEKGVFGFHLLKKAMTLKQLLKTIK